MQSGEIDQAHALLAESAALAQQGNDLQSHAWAQITQARIELVQQHLERSRLLFEQARFHEEDSVKNI
ncbi:MAG TPA: hypothetical protein VF458_23615 [Ktedonobacteraceae bacterium]